MSSTNMPSSFDGDTILRIEPMAEADPPVERRAPRASGYASSHSTNALYHASKSIRSGDQQRTNRMFRARIYAQGFTIVAMVAGSMYWKSDRQKRKEFDRWWQSARRRRRTICGSRSWRREIKRRKRPELKRREDRSVLNGGKNPILAQVRAAEGKDSEDASSVVDGKEKKQKSTLESVKEMIMGKK
ncbi:Respiratory supercomplex factor 1, mitochondrial [Pseudogymnoascus destructans]|uniref:Respiratory supercomplex factor 1, mitochondrial n=1 Tax=Pseudogymnoascus destructans TaxID=655981 RepID=A0A177A9Y8_9PEZI|nr:Respiratory supercomplex factor 1, mitochondrial [Pseudogymnoascus destructans]OAF58945.1 Respiratory supercomplex factor 1, mitochondrial [Pseudogymnoascus destructans]